MVDACRGMSASERDSASEQHKGAEGTGHREREAPPPWWWYRGVLFKSPVLAPGGVDDGLGPGHPESGEYTVPVRIADERMGDELRQYIAVAAWHGRGMLAEPV